MRMIGEKGLAEWGGGGEEKGVAVIVVVYRIR